MVYMTLELQLFASLADYARDVWEIVGFFLVISQVKLKLLKYCKALAAEDCRSILESILT